jgi:hypothetical protein
VGWWLFLFLTTDKHGKTDSGASEEQKYGKAEHR